MLSEDYSVEFKQRFTDRYAGGATIAMLQHELGLAKPTVKPWRERTDQGGVGAMDRPRENNRYPQEFKLRVVEACLRGESDYRALALEHGVRNSARTCQRAVAPPCCEYTSNEHPESAGQRHLFLPDTRIQETD